MNFDFSERDQNSDRNSQISKNSGNTIYNSQNEPVGLRKKQQKKLTLPQTNTENQSSSDSISQNKNDDCSDQVIIEDNSQEYEFSTGQSQKSGSQTQAQCKQLNLQIMEFPFFENLRAFFT